MFKAATFNPYAIKTSNVLINIVASHGIQQMLPNSQLKTFDVLNACKRDNIRIIVFDLITTGLPAIQTFETSDMFANLFNTEITRILSDKSLTNDLFNEQIQNLQAFAVNRYLDIILSEIRTLISNETEKLLDLINEIQDDLLNPITNDLNDADVIGLLKDIPQITGFLADLYNTIMLFYHPSDMMVCSVYDKNNQMMPYKKWAADGNLEAESKANASLANWNIMACQGGSVPTLSLRNDLPILNYNPALVNIFDNSHIFTPKQNAEFQKFRKQSEAGGYAITNEQLLKTELGSDSNYSVKVCLDSSCMTVHTPTNAVVADHVKVETCRQQRDALCTNKLQMRQVDAEQIISRMKLIEGVEGGSLYDDRAYIKKLCIELNNFRDDIIKIKQTKKNLKSLTPKNIDAAFIHIDALLAAAAEEAVEDANEVVEIADAKMVVPVAEVEPMVVAEAVEVAPDAPMVAAANEVVEVMADADEVMADAPMVVIADANEVVEIADANKVGPEIKRARIYAAGLGGGRRKRKSKKQKGSKRSKKRRNKYFRKTYKKRRHVRKTRKR